MLRKQTSAPRSVGIAQEKYLRRNSDVIPVGLGTERQERLLCWTADSPAVRDNPELLFSLCAITSASTKDRFVLEGVDPPTHGLFELEPSKVLNANTDCDPLKTPDIGLLTHKNVACVLSMLKERYKKGKIYTTADPLLVAVNPFKDLGNATDEWIEYYRDMPNITAAEPHVFKIARVALSNLEEYGKSQTIIVSGESGAGKTEATKHMMRYFAAAASNGSRVQDAIMAGNPLLEAFGNAKTIRNNNSSRFGRFMKLEVSTSAGILSGEITNFLLEKLLKGADQQMRATYHLRPMREYTFLTERSGGCFDIKGVDDVQNFAEVRRSFKSMNLSKEEESSVFSILSGVLLIGNTKIVAKDIQGLPDAACILPDSSSILMESAELLFADAEKLMHNVLKKKTKVGNNVVEGPRTFREADMIIKSIAKHVYDQLFAWLVRYLNKEIAPSKGFSCFMGMLDIFGFEVFELNSFEQLLINITNEHLQKHFIDVVFENETKLYQREGIPTEELVWTDNLNIMDALCGPHNSVFSIIEDTCLGLRASDEALCGMIVRKLAGRGVILSSRRDQRIKFVVRHTIADIEYSCDGFIVKNQDFLKKELLDVFKASQNQVMSELFESVHVEAGKIGKGSLIASQFLRSLSSMIETIKETEPHFIRCLKPNETKEPLNWNAAKVLNQLFSLSILEALQLRQIGYSYRRTFEQFVCRFKWLDLGVANSNMDRREAVLKMLGRVGLSRDEWVMGKTMVFLKADAAKKVAAFQLERMFAFRPLVESVGAAWKRILIKRELESITPHLIRAEAHCRRRVDVIKNGDIDLPPGFTETLLQGVAMVHKRREERQRLKEEQRLLSQQNRAARRLTKDEKIAEEVLRMYKSWDSIRSVSMSLTDYIPPQKEFEKLKYSRPKVEKRIKAKALAHVSRQVSFENTSVSYRLWQNIESVYAAPVNSERLQNIATCLRDEMDQKYGHFWQVVMNRNERFGLASTHKKGYRHAVGQKGVYMDRRVFCFNHILFQTVKPSTKELRLHEEAAEKSYLICRKRNLSHLVRVKKSLVPPYLIQDASYLIGYLYNRFKESGDWTAFAVRLQSYLMGRYSEPYGGAWNVLVQEGSFLVTRLWLKHNRYFRVEIDMPNEASIDGSQCLTVMCFEACASSE